MTTPTLIRAAELLEEDAQALFQAHTINGHWDASVDGEPAKTKHAELIEIASRLRAIQRGAVAQNEHECSNSQLLVQTLEQEDGASIIQSISRDDDGVFHITLNKSHSKSGLVSVEVFIGVLRELFL